MNITATILGLVGELAPLARDAALGTISEQEARQLLRQTLQQHQQQLDQLDQQLAANDAAADAAVAALPAEPRP